MFSFAMEYQLAHCDLDNISHSKLSIFQFWFDGVSTYFLYYISNILYKNIVHF